MVIVHAMTRRKFQVAAVHSRRCGTRAIESLLYAQSKHQIPASKACPERQSNGLQRIFNIQFPNAMPPLFGHLEFLWMLELDVWSFTLSTTDRPNR